MKLWLINLQGMITSIDSAPYGKAYVLADNADEAANKINRIVSR